ncbi:hypothetical protein F5884DRAFT_757452 [Xylogone sp. PMI_703]|nr:hypothetical protein F5884DRAFT_757452 [Xylogone sp. PMI_703]
MAQKVVVDSRKRAGRPKSRTGCSTCRERRVKCDETIPTCRRCQSSGRECRGLWRKKATYLQLLAPKSTLEVSQSLEIRDAKPPDSTTDRRQEGKENGYGDDEGPSTSRIEESSLSLTFPLQLSLGDQEDSNDRSRQSSVTDSREHSKRHRIGKRSVDRKTLLETRDTIKRARRDESEEVGDCIVVSFRPTPGEAQAMEKSKLTFTSVKPLTVSPMDDAISPTNRHLPCESAEPVQTAQEALSAMHGEPVEGRQNGARCPESTLDNIFPDSKVQRSYTSTCPPPPKPGILQHHIGTSQHPTSATEDCFVTEHVFHPADKPYKSQSNARNGRQKVTRLADLIKSPRKLSQPITQSETLLKNAREVSLQIAHLDNLLKNTPTPSQPISHAAVLIRNPRGSPPPIAQPVDLSEKPQEVSRAVTRSATPLGNPDELCQPIPAAVSKNRPELSRAIVPLPAIMQDPERLPHLIQTDSLHSIQSLVHNTNSGTCVPRLVNAELANTRYSNMAAKSSSSSLTVSRRSATSSLIGAHTAGPHHPNAHPTTPSFTPSPEFLIPTYQPPAINFIAGLDTRLSPLGNKATTPEVQSSASTHHCEVPSDYATVSKTHILPALPSNQLPSNNNRPSASRAYVPSAPHSPKNNQLSPFKQHLTPSSLCELRSDNNLASSLQTHSPLPPSGHLGSGSISFQRFEMHLEPALPSHQREPDSHQILASTMHSQPAAISHKLWPDNSHAEASKTHYAPVPLSLHPASDKNYTSMSRTYAQLNQTHTPGSVNCLPQPLAPLVDVTSPVDGSSTSANRNFSTAQSSSVIRPSRTVRDQDMLRQAALKLIERREDVELEESEISGGRGRTYPSVCGVIVDQNSAKGRVVIYGNGSSPPQVDTGHGVVGERYSELTIGAGQTCVVHGRSTVLFYKPRIAPRPTQDPMQGPHITIRLQIDEAGRFSNPYDMSAFNKKWKTTQFFTWFGTQTGRGGAAGPRLLKFTLKDAMPIPRSITIAKLNENDFRWMTRDIMVQFDIAKSFLPSLAEFCVLVTDPGWEAPRSMSTTAFKTRAAKFR